MFRPLLVMSLLGSSLLLGITLVCRAEEPKKSEKTEEDGNREARLRAIREIMQQIAMSQTSTNGKPLPLELKSEPLLRYRDITRGILDSVIFRVGLKGRPAALISAELYGRSGNRMLLNHEFVALDQPDYEMQRDQFHWEPTEGNLKWQNLTEDEAPAKTAPLRLAQMRRISSRFSATQRFGAQVIELQRLPTPLDRYQPTEDPQSDGSLFAFTWGLNPETVLVIETLDGEAWRFAWTPLGAAPLEARMDDRVVWERLNPALHETTAAPYTSIHRSIVIPAYFDESSDKPVAPTP